MKEEGRRRSGTRASFTRSFSSPRRSGSTGSREFARGGRAGRSVLYRLWRALRSGGAKAAHRGRMSPRGAPLFSDLLRFIALRAPEPNLPVVICRSTASGNDDDLHAREARAPRRQGPLAPSFMLRAELGRGDGGDSGLGDRIRDMRFERTALYAHEHGFDVISSSLGISRLKNLNQVNAFGQRMVETAKRERFYLQAQGRERTPRRDRHARAGRGSLLEHAPLVRGAGAALAEVGADVFALRSGWLHGAIVVAALAVVGVVAFAASTELRRREAHVRRGAEEDALRTAALRARLDELTDGVRRRRRER